MNMTIKNLKIENFKGVRNFEFNPDADLTIISAKNGIGKTTIYDAFLWLLFGTNSAGEAKFDIRPKDAPYEIEPTVSAVIVVDGKETELYVRPNFFFTSNDFHLFRLDITANSVS